MNDKIELSIVMPCLNEAETLEKCITKARNFLAKEKIIGEVVISDNGSSDGSQDIAHRNNARLVNASEKGYGSALREGIRSAHGKFIIMGDADDSYDFENLSAFLLKLRQGYDLVMGNRFKGGIMKGAMPFLHRYLGNPVLSFIGRLFFSIKIYDFHCGLRGFSKEAFDKINPKTTGMEFASEIVVKAALLKMNICEVPTILSPDGRSRPPHLRTWHDGWRHLRFLLLFSPRWLFLFPGILLLTLSIVFGGYIFFRPLRLSNTVFDIHTLIYLSFGLLISIQLIFFHFFARTYTRTIGILPEDDRFKKIFSLFTLERGLLLGALVLLIGVYLSFQNLYYWNIHNFGRLNPVDFMRQVVGATLTLALGAQIVIYSFVFSFLGIRK